MDPLLEINRSLGSIDGKLDALTERFDRHDRVHSTLEKDVDQIQADVNKVKGASTVVGIFAAAVGAVSALVAKYFWGK